MTWTLNDISVNLNVMFFLMYYLVLIIHELGHVVATKLIKGTIQEIHFGEGEKWFDFYVLKINRWVFIPTGKVYSDYDRTSWNRLFVFSGGNIFLLLICAAVNLAFSRYSLQELIQFNISTAYMVFITMLPVNYSNGVKSDGLQIVNLIKEIKKSRSIE
ncbi:site-2 protease family protein [Alkalibacterium olivapovliticus]|uniref:Peptidase M50 domain-containing protein n=1 Tax=Alkalibacterium olivapovliticus TaxID=99907 RepID=A0A2T0W3Q1_9LACT|nr:site-2 protease family protein [Alkalibacterium olivapovliticus]PRY80088.1 hypothetical protein CLV38_12224 [Alkalibacterium olivapovliticus]